MNAEQAYLFRHALLREAAYQLQLPADRAKLHALAFTIIEAKAPTGASAIALELADHAAAGREHQPGLRQSEKQWLLRAVEYSEQQSAFMQAAAIWARLKDLADAATETVAANLGMGRNLLHAGRYADAEREMRECLNNPAASARDKCQAAANIASYKVIQQRYAEAQQEYARVHEQYAAHLDPKIRLSMLISEVIACKGAGNFARAEQLSLEGIEQARALNDARLLSTLRINLANLYRVIRRAPEALAILSEEYAMARAAGQEGWMVAIGVNLAWCHHGLGDFSAAKTLSEELAAHLDSAPAGARYAAEYLRGRIAQDLGQHEESKRHEVKALNWALELGHVRDAADALHSLVLRSEDDLDEASRWLARLRLLAESTRDTKVNERYQNAMAGVCSRSGRYEEALHAHETAWRFARQLNDKHAECLNRGNSGLQCVKLGRAEAADMLRDALSIAVAHGFRFQQAWWEAGLAVCAALSGDAGRAREHGRNALRCLAEGAAPALLEREREVLIQFVIETAAARATSLEALRQELAQPLKPTAPGQPLQS